MKERTELQTELETLLGSRNVYFQPPENIRINYPCFVYERSSLSAKFADENERYQKYFRYQITYITKDPDTNDLIDNILSHFKYCTYERHFVMDGLNHEVFNLYY